MNRCLLCKLKEESIDHILLHCTKAKILQYLFFSLFSVVWVIPSLVKDIMFKLARFLHREEKDKGLRSCTPLHF